MHVLSNDYLMIEVSELGAGLRKFVDKKTGRNIVLGFPDDEGYLNHHDAYVGASVGRNANRISNGQFVLNGKQYQLTINNHMNQNHGGINDFSVQMWKVEHIDGNEIVLSYFSKDGEEGFPGNLNAKVSYRLDNNSLIYTYSGISDQDTLFSMTNHSYFNLGDKDIMNHSLYIATDRYSPADEYALTKDEILSTRNTPYDFSEYTLLKDNLCKFEKGIDNNYVWENMDDKLMASLRYDGLELNVYSNLPDLHLYTGYYLDLESEYFTPGCSGLCLEAQYFPNGINYKDKIVPILKKDEERSNYIKFEINHY